MLIVLISVSLSFSQNLNTSSLDCEKVVGYEVLVVKLYFKLGESLKNRMWNENTVYACMYIKHAQLGIYDRKLSGHSVKVYHDCMVHSRITKT